MSHKRVGLEERAKERCGFLSTPCANNHPFNVSTVDRQADRQNRQTDTDPSGVHGKARSSVIVSRTDRAESPCRFIGAYRVTSPHCAHTVHLCLGVRGLGIAALRSIRVV